MVFLKNTYNYITRLANNACLETDSDREKTRKSVLTIVAFIISFLAIFWGSGYFALGKPYSAAIPLGYALISFLNITYYLYTKHFEFFRFSQLLLIFCLPFSLMWSLGGFSNGSVVMIWAFLTPLAAMFFADIKHATHWVYAFLIMTVFSAFIDDYLQQTISPLSDTAITVFFMLNMGFGFGCIFLVLNYFVKEREAAYALTLKAKKELECSNQKLQENEKKIKKLLMTDWLTGIANRRYLDQRLQSELDKFHRHGNSLSLIMADLDNFKKINDNHGHAIGDEVIKAFTQVMQNNIRSTDLISRYGGEEFIIMLPETSQAGAEDLAERIRVAMEAEKIEGVSGKVTASFGITIAKEKDTFESLLRRADHAMYESKDKGRNCCSVL
jgi:diguanylate cyclase (GGDEF)-like protein